MRRFEDIDGTVSAYAAGQVQPIAGGASVAGSMMGKNPQLNPEFKLLLKDSPNYTGVAKVSDRLVFMHAGRIHEMGPPGQVFGAPQTAEPKQFLSALGRGERVADAAE